MGSWKPKVKTVEGRRCPDILRGYRGPSAPKGKGTTPENNPRGCAAPGTRAIGRQAQTWRGELGSNIALRWPGNVMGMGACHRDRNIVLWMGLAGWGVHLCCSLARAGIESPRGWNGILGHRWGERRSGREGEEGRDVKAWQDPQGPSNN